MCLAQMARCPQTWTGKGSLHHSPRKGYSNASSADRYECLPSISCTALSPFSLMQNCEEGGHVGAADMSPMLG